MRGWPRTLFWRLVLILVAGMMGAQILTGSIWYEVRHTEAMEIPLRLAAARLADIQRQAERDPERIETLVQALDRPGFHLTLANGVVPATPPADAGAEQLLQHAFEEAGGEPGSLQLSQATLTTLESKPVGWRALMTSTHPYAQLTMTLALADGQWLRAVMLEAQGWTSRSPFDGAWDYLFRLYFLRIAAVILLALVAVRLAIGPLEKLAQAADRLGNDIRQPPLPNKGPLEVRRAALAFNAMQQRLIDHLAERARFLAAVSHDLRSPITRLRLRTEVLRDDRLKESFRRDLDGMESLVAATLDVLQESDHQEAFERVDVQSILLGIQADAQEQGETLPLRGEVRWPLYGHPQSLQRAMRNLVENAFRYASDVEVVIDDTPECLSISVLDRGPGIADDQLAQVTAPFYRLEASRNAHTGGYGLGLSIVQTVLEAHRGQLVLGNRPDGGLEARAELPRHEHADNV